MATLMEGLPRGWMPNYAHQTSMNSRPELHRPQRHALGDQRPQIHSPKAALTVDVEATRVRMMPSLRV